MWAWEKKKGGGGGSEWGGGGGILGKELGKFSNFIAMVDSSSSDKTTCTEGEWVWGVYGGGELMGDEKEDAKCI